MKTFILGSAKYKNPKTKQFESLPCLKGDKGEKGGHLVDSRPFVLDQKFGIHPDQLADAYP